MGLLKSKEHKELEKLIKERDKKEKEMNKELERRMKVKYTSKFLKENKKHLTENAMQIDDVEYRKAIEELKKCFPNIDQ